MFLITFLTHNIFDTFIRGLLIIYFIIRQTKIIDIAIFIPKIIVILRFFSTVCCAIAALDFHPDKTTLWALLKHILDL